MNKSLVAGLCATVAVLASGAAFAANPKAEPYLKQVEPPMYVSPIAAQAACPTDQVVWLNTSANVAHLPSSKWYAHTTTGAYACERPSAALGYHVAG